MLAPRSRRRHDDNGRRLERRGVRAEHLTLQHAGQLVQHIVKAARNELVFEAARTDHRAGSLHHDVQAVDFPHETADAPRWVLGVDGPDFGLGEWRVALPLGILHCWMPVYLYSIHSASRTVNAWRIRVPTAAQTEALSSAPAVTVKQPGRSLLTASAPARGGTSRRAGCAPAARAPARRRPPGSLPGCGPSPA